MLSELVTLGRMLRRRADDILAYFDRPRTSNGPTEAINNTYAAPRWGWDNLGHDTFDHWWMLDLISIPIYEQPLSWIQSRQVCTAQVYKCGAGCRRFQGCTVQMWRSCTRLAKLYDGGTPNRYTVVPCTLFCDELICCSCIFY